MTETPQRVVVTGLIADLTFGPVDSRRLGKSLGINAFPANLKICTFNCPYCECGWTDVPKSREFEKLAWPSVANIVLAVKNRLDELQTQNIKIDFLTFAGNGEPTLHPNFMELIDALIELKKISPTPFKLAVLTNATRLSDPNIVTALQKVDEVAYKLDAGSQQLFQEMDLPVHSITLRDIVDSLKTIPHPTIQSMFTQGRVDNTTPTAVADWVARLVEINPGEVQIYSIDRKTPDLKLQPVSKQRLVEIGDEVRKVLPSTIVNAY
jgi:wyosine [tRNA(Phe)-imidazoG37] synthetase (radical SAM superfamily)